MLNNKGQTLIIMILLLLVVGLMLPMGTFLGRHEAKQAVGEKKATEAFHVAEAGMDRAQWKFDESQANWTNCSTAGTLPDANFNGVFVFTDVAQGEYKVKASSGPNAGNVTVWVVGKDKSGAGVRGMKAVYSRQGANEKAIDADGNIDVSGNFEIHWGPAKSRGNLDLSGTGAQRYYPRKYATGNLTGTGGFPRDTNSGTPPNTDNVEWWSHYDLPEANPTLSTYETRAKAYISTVPVPGSGGTAHTAGCLPNANGGYHPHNMTFNGYNGPMTAPSGSTPTFYCTGNMDIKNCYIKADVITTGNVDFSGSGSGVATVTIPPLASKEYQHPDGLAVWTANGWTDGGSYAITNLTLHGLLFASGNISAAGGTNRVYGVVMTNGNASNLNGNVILYYSDTVNSALEAADLKWVRQSWEEYAAPDWSSPNWP